MDDLCFRVKLWCYIHFTKRGRLENAVYEATMLMYPVFIRREGFAPTLYEESLNRWRRFYAPNR